MPSVAGPVEVPRWRIAWLVNSAQYDQASVRYRCAHPAAQLQLRAWRNTVWTDSRKLLERLDGVDAVVIVKRIEPDIVALTTRCAELGKRVFIDLCDDVVSPDGRSAQRLLPQAVLRAVAPLVEAFFCPTPAMQKRLHGYLAGDGLFETPVRVVPDCIETDELYRISAAVWPRLLALPPAQPPASKEAQPEMHLDPALTHLVWFGNWGGPHSDFGIGSLLPVIATLNGYAHRHELAVHVVSNHAGLGALLRARAKFQLVYHDWSRPLLSTLLAQAQFALLTTGDDQFSAIKSPNRLLLALAAGVPVIVDADASATLWPDRDAVPTTDRIVEILGQVRDEGYAPVKQRMLAAVQPALDAYRIERLGSLYADLLSRDRRAGQAQARPIRRLAHVFGPDEDLDLALKIRDHCRDQGIEFVAMTSARTLAARKSLFGFLARHRIKPSIVADEEAQPTDSRRLRGADVVVLASSTAQDLGSQVQAWCRARGVPLLSQGAFLYRFGER